MTQNFNRKIKIINADTLKFWEWHEMASKRETDKMLTKVLYFLIRVISRDI